MEEEKQPQRRRRLIADWEVLESIAPVCKLPLEEPANGYFVPLSSLPMSPSERVRVKDFLDRLLRKYLEQAREPVLGYLGVIHSLLKNDVLRTVAMNCMEWHPTTGLAFLPDQPAPRLPTQDEVIAWEGVIPLDEVLPMITYITDQGAVPKARKALFGCGATASYFSPLAESAFLKKTKEIFGHRIEDPALRLLECLPFFTADALLAATGDQFRALFSAVPLYIGESAKDLGVLLVSAANLDTQIADLASLLSER